jgi:hypothetical protein
MRTRYRRDLRDDRGSIILALLGILILTTVASVGLAAVVNGQHQTRHDNTFSQSLNNAESGIDAMVANIKANYNSPTIDTPPNDLTSANYTVDGFTVHATPINNIDKTGNVNSTTWTITATGNSTTQNNTISRTVSETVTILHTYHAPVLGTDALQLQPGSGVGDYTIGDANHPCDPAHGASACAPPTPISNGVTIPALNLSFGATKITNIPVGATPGGAETGGTLSMSAGDLQNFAQLAVDNSETCEAAAGVGSPLCSTTAVVSQQGPPPTIETPGCESYDGIGAGVQLAKHNGLDLNIPDGILVLNTNVDAQLIPPGINGQTVCTNLPVVVPTVAVNLNNLTNLVGLSGLTNLTGLGAALDVPIGSSCTDINLNNGVIQALLGLLTTDSLSCAMNDPSSLVINQLGNQPVYLGSGTGCAFPVPSGCTPMPTYVSAEINNPGGNCDIDGNVVLYGAINCKTITMEPGSTLQVYYPTDAGLTYGDTEHHDTVLDWNETH